MKNKFEQIVFTDLKNGFVYDKQVKRYTCLFCNFHYEEGYIYTFANRLVDAKKAIVLHIHEEHKSVFETLLSDDKKQTGLTDIQKHFLLCFYNGMSDKDTAKETGTSPSTVRYQRHSFREKAKQARLTLALAELLQEKIFENGSAISLSNKNTDDIEDRIDAFFESVSPLVLKTFSVKRVNQLFILKIIAQQFEREKRYTENQVNEILKPIYDDYVLLRRELIDFKFLKRTADCREYWVSEE